MAIETQKPIEKTKSNQTNSNSNPQLRQPRQTTNYNFNYNYKYKNKEIEIKIKMYRRSTITVNLHHHNVPSQFLAFVSLRAFREPIPQHLDHQEATRSRFLGQSRTKQLRTASGRSLSICLATGSPEDVPVETQCLAPSACESATI